MYGLKLKEYREKANLSQRDIADILKLTQQAYCRWEVGKSVPNATQIIQLCKIFKCTPNDLFGIRDIYDKVFIEWNE